jgi:HAE1 family hydrophobic/amphiphilic exporter-1
VILRWDPTSRPISILTLKGDAPIEELTDFAEEVVKPAIQQVDGISKAEVVGGSIREILVEPDEHRMSIYGITVEQIQGALVRSNVSFPGGKIRQGPLQMSLRIDGEYSTIDEIAATDIVRPGASPVRIADVARVVDTTKEAEGHTLLGADPVVSLLIYKEPESNTIRVTDEVDTALGMLEKDYRGFAYRYVYRDADYVRSSFSSLVQSLLLGSLLAFLVLFLFLYDVRSPLIVGVAIPVSLLITFMFLYIGKVKLNLMSLGGLSFASGLLVDNAIIVIENINRHLEEKFGHKKVDRHDIETRRAIARCAETGTREMGNAVMACTLTTVAVFLPVVYVPGIAGAFFRDQALTITIALSVSILTALLLQPMMSARMLQIGARERRGLFRATDNAFNRFATFYHGVLEKALARPGLMVTLLVVGLVASVFLGARIERTLMPARSQGDMRLELELPTGTPLEETSTKVGRLAGWIEEDPSVTSVFTQVGTTERTLAAMRDYTAPNTARMRIIVKPGRHAARDAKELEDAITARLAEVPGVRYAFREEGVGLAEVLSTGEAPFSMGVVAENPVDAVSAAQEILEALAGAHRLRDLQVQRVLDTPNLVVHLDTEEILRAGLDPDAIARDVRNRISGVEATTFNEVEKRIDISVRFPLEERRDLAGVLESPVMVAGTETMPLKQFLSIDEERPVRELTRSNQRRMVTISGQIAGNSITKAWDEAQEIVKQLDLPPDVKIVQGGERAEMESSFRDLGWALLLAFVLVYMILAAQFESFIDPLHIAITIPIGAAGTVVALFVTGMTVNILSLIGLITLLGIAVDDAIVKTDTMRQLRAQGMEGYAAIMEACRVRARPIIMNSCTAILAMVPLAIGLGGGAQLQRPLALTIIGGLTLTTALTLIYTPLFYMLVHRIKRPVS